MARASVGLDNVGASVRMDGEAASRESDESLMALVRAGDEVAFNVLVLRYQRRVIGYLLNMLRDREDALDGAQEVFVRLHGRAHLYEPSYPLRCWLYRMATNVAIDTMRRRKRRRWVSLAALPLAIGRGRDGRNRAPVEPGWTTDDAGALDDVLESEQTRVVRSAIATLPERYRAVLVLRDLQELSYEEVAQVLRCQVGTVKSRVNRARTMLRDKLATYMSGKASQAETMS